MKKIFCTAGVMFLSLLPLSHSDASDNVCKIFKPDSTKYLQWNMDVVSADPVLGVIKFINPNKDGLIPFIIGTFTTLDDGMLDLILIQYPVGSTPCVGVQSSPEYPSKEQKMLPKHPQDRKLGI